MTKPSEYALRVAIAGFGAIGQEIARHIDAGRVPGLSVSAVAARDREKARRNAAELARPPAVVASGGLAELAEGADVVVECAPAAVFRQIAEPAVDRGRIFVPLSVGALLDHEDLVERAAETGARIMVPTGALLGLDAIKALSLSPVEEIRITTRKPPGGLAGAPHLVENGISVEGLREPLKIFEGSAREAIKGFPANVNVAVALSLAGIGPDRTAIEIWADPSVTRNTHRITAAAEAGSLSMTIENVPSEANPRTGKVTALSALALLRRLTGTLVVGS